MTGMWKRALVYLGLAEEDDDLDEHYDEEPEPGRRSLRRVGDEGRARPEAVVRQMPAPTARFHLLQPTTFDDAQELGDKFREGYSVLMNLQGSERDLARRLIDFASGLAYGRGGSMQPVAEEVFLVTPAGVQVSAEDRRRLLEERGFFNQA